MDRFDLTLPHGADERLLVDIVVVMTAGVLLAMLARRVGQSPVIGYLLAGVLLGPSAFGVITQVDAFPVIGEIGVALLLFTVGLELSWTSVRHSSGLPLGGAALQVVATVVVVLGCAVAAGLGAPTALMVGMIVALSSTAVVLRVLAERTETDSVHGRIALAILLVQDVLAVGFLLLIPVLGDDPSGADAVASFGVAVVKLAGVVAVMALLDRLLMRRLFHHASSSSERELLVVLSLAVALGAAGATDVLGLSPMVGAFVAGLLIGDAVYSDQVHAEIGPLRTGLLVLFFAFVGMTVDLNWLAEHWLAVIAAVAAVFAVKIVVTTGTLRALGTDWRHALLAAVVVGQLGEFALVVAAAAKAEALIGADLHQLVISTTFVSILVTPSAIKYAVGWANSRTSGAQTVDHAHRRRGHVVVVGLGPSGICVAEALHERGDEILAVELSRRLTHPDFLQRGAELITGDAGRVEILHAADIATARLLVVTVPDPIGAGRVIRQARSLVDELPILARGRYHRHVDQLLEAGATVVVDEEFGVGRDLATRAAAILDESH